MGQNHQNETWAASVKWTRVLTWSTSSFSAVDPEPPGFLRLSWSLSKQVRMCLCSSRADLRGGGSKVNVTSEPQVQLVLWTEPVQFLSLVP